MRAILALYFYLSPNCVMEKYEIKIDNFEGPLDLLCHLIDRNKMDICEIKISDITDQYIDYIKVYTKKPE